MAITAATMHGTIAAHPTGSAVVATAAARPASTHRCRFRAIRANATNKMVPASV